jgi:hypothetical protein
VKAFNNLVVSKNYILDSIKNESIIDLTQEENVKFVLWKPEVTPSTTATSKAAKKREQIPITVARRDNSDQPISLEEVTIEEAGKH